MTKVKTETVCIMEGCKFTTTSIRTLQKHYEQDHSLKERVKGSLVISEYEYFWLDASKLLAHIGYTFLFYFPYSSSELCD